MDKLKFKDMSELQEFLNTNLLAKNEAAEVTDQSPGAFNQSVKLGYIKPFYENEGKGPAKVKLYLRSDLEHYRDTKSNINKP